MSDSWSTWEDWDWEAEPLSNRDYFTVVWISLWILPTTVLMVLLIKNRINDKTANARGRKIWILGFFVCLCLYLLQICTASSWISWTVTMDYSETSATFIFDMVIETLYMLTFTSLYSFFIYRLYLVYNGQHQSMFTLKKYWYLILSILNISDFVLLLLSVITWRKYDYKTYAMYQGISLVVEIVLTVILAILFSKPLLKIININSEAVPESGTNDMLALLARMNILNFIALLSSIISRSFYIGAYIHCDECDFTFIGYNSFPIDIFVNIFCILCSFATGKKYKHKFQSHTGIRNLGTLKFYMFIEHSVCNTTSLGAISCRNMLFWCYLLVLNMHKFINL